MTEGARFATVLALSATLVGAAVAVAVMQLQSDATAREPDLASAELAGGAPSPGQGEPSRESESQPPDDSQAIGRFESPADPIERSSDPDGAADVEAEPTPQSMEALQQAIISGDYPALEAAIAAGASIRAFEAAGTSSLILALENGHIAMLHGLAVLGADLNARDQEQETPLMWAARVGDGAGVYDLLIHGAEVDAVDLSGQTALFEAVNGGRVEAVRLLLQWRADVNHRDNEGLAPLNYADGDADQQLIDTLRAAGGLQYLPPPIL